LKDVRRDAERTYSYIFEKPENLHWQEGAHAHLAIEGFQPGRGEEGKQYVRHLSIQSLAEEDRLTITTRIPEPCSFFKEGLKKAKSGDIFQVFKVGSNMALRRDNRPVVLMSAGVGIATMRPLLKTFSLNQTDISWISHTNIDSSGEFLFKEEIEAYVAATASVRSQYVKTRDEFYQELDRGFEKRAYYYIVGSDEFLVTVGKNLLAKGLSIDSIILDKKKEFYSELL
jgi:ferredoxin--NADP+ reductase